MIALWTPLAPLLVHTTSTAMTQETHSACFGVFTEVQARPSVQDRLSPVLASKVTSTLVQHEARKVTIQWTQNLRSGCTRVDEVPTRRQWMKVLREPQQNTLGRAVHDGGQGLRSQVWGTARSTICSTTSSETRSCGMIFTTFTICR